MKTNLLFSIFVFFLCFKTDAQKVDQDSILLYHYVSIAEKYLADRAVDNCVPTVVGYDPDAIFCWDTNPPYAFVVYQTTEGYLYESSIFYDELMDRYCSYRSSEPDTLFDEYGDFDGPKSDPATFKDIEEALIKANCPPIEVKTYRR